MTSLCIIHFWSTCPEGESYFEVCQERTVGVWRCCARLCPGSDNMCSVPQVSSIFMTRMLSQTFYFRGMFDCWSSSGLFYSLLPCVPFVFCTWSLRYHNLNPNYIHERLKQLGNSFTLRVLLVQVDVVSTSVFVLKIHLKICKSKSLLIYVLKNTQLERNVLIS